MDNLSVISERISELHSLSSKDVIHFEDLREEFRQDLRTFVVGETLSIRDGKVTIGRNLYKMWLNKLRTKGFDYEIDFKQ